MKVRADDGNRTVTDTFNITADEISVKFESPTYSVEEGLSATVTVTLSEAPRRSVTIPITATGQSGASTADYTAPAATVTFSSTQTSRTVTLTTTEDTIPDDGESVVLGFGTLPTGVTLG